MLKFRTDDEYEILHEHIIKTCAKNASYISNSTQNDLIECCGELLKNKIEDNIEKSNCFSNIADETTYVSICEQVTICIRYFEVDTKEIQKDFLMFVEDVKLNGENIAHHILKALENLKLDITLCRSQAYDRRVNMCGKKKGVNARIFNSQPLASVQATDTTQLLVQYAQLPSIRIAERVSNCLS